MVGAERLNLCSQSRCATRLLRPAASLPCRAANHTDGIRASI
jgi:hypothetical protein